MTYGTGCVLCGDDVCTRLAAYGFADGGDGVSWSSQGTPVCLFARTQLRGGVDTGADTW